MAEVEMTCEATGTDTVWFFAGVDRLSLLYGVDPGRRVGK